MMCTDFVSKPGESRVNPCLCFSRGNSSCFPKGEMSPWAGDEEGHAPRVQRGCLEIKTWWARCARPARHVHVCVWVGCKAGARGPWPGWMREVGLFVRLSGPCGALSPVFDPARGLKSAWWIAPRQRRGGAKQQDLAYKAVARQTCE